MDFFEWNLISITAPPTKEWLEFYDGSETMRADLQNHIDKIDKHGNCIVNYIHNYTHWRHLGSPHIMAKGEV